MADPTGYTSVTTESIGYEERYSFVIADGETLYTNSLVGIIDASGLLDYWADTAADKFAGLLVGGDERVNDGVITGETSDTDPPRGRVLVSGFYIKNLATLGGTPTQAKIGDPVYAASGNIADLTLTAGTVIVGYLADFRSATDVDVRILSMAEAFVLEQTNP